MGIIIAGLKLIKPAYDFVLQMAPKVHTNALQGNMEKFVNDCFQTLRPLTYKYREVCDIEHRYGGRTYTTKLCIGEWLRVKSTYQTYGSTLDHSESVFNYIRNYGDELKTHVRRPIKEDFARLVDLAKELQSYNEVLVKLQLPEKEVFEYYCPNFSYDDKAIKLTSMTLNAIGVKTSDPWTLLLFQNEEEEPETRHLTDESKVSIFEDIISYMVDLFKRADAEVSVVREHNEKVMEEMARIVGPWKIANQLKNNKY